MTNAHTEHDFGVVTFIFAIAAGIACRTWVTQVTQVPYTVLLLLVGGMVGVLHKKANGIFSEGFDESVDEWLQLSPEVVLFTFLPVLVFESALATDAHIFQRQLKQILVLAIPGVAAASCLTATFAHYVLPYNWDWNTCLMFGAMMSATDPVAVVALLKELGVSERLGVLIEGESLLNDGTSIVVFQVFKTAVVAGQIALPSPSTIALTTLRLGVGGVAYGVAVGAFGTAAIGSIMNDAPAEISATIVVAYASFIGAEGTALHVSGVLACVLAGLVMSRYV